LGVTHDARLDTGTTGTAGGADSKLATVSR
jgi:hypothetical protein